MDFILGDSVVIGVCSSLSESGLRGTFSEPIAIGANGPLTLYYQNHKCEVKANVDSSRENEARIGFEFTSEEDRSALISFLKLLAKP